MSDIERADKLISLDPTKTSSLKKLQRAKKVAKEKRDDNMVDEIERRFQKKNPNKDVVFNPTKGAKIYKPR